MCLILKTLEKWCLSNLLVSSIIHEPLGLQDPRAGGKKQSFIEFHAPQ